jgi:hypothetical protein
MVLKVTPRIITFTGADDEVDIEELFEQDQKCNKVEWGILDYPEARTRQRNPSRSWCEKFLARGFKRTAIHLCGDATFQQLLTLNPGGDVIKEKHTYISRFNRVQININARADNFSDDDIVRIYHILHDAGNTVILQYHDATKNAIRRFINRVNKESANFERINVLFDGSLGRGTVTETYSPPISDNIFHSYAGGLGPDNVAQEVYKMLQVIPVECRNNYGIDMESGIRTNNEFDIYKVRKVLRARIRTW